MKYFLILTVLVNIMFANNLDSSKIKEDKTSLSAKSLKALDPNKEIPKYKENIFSKLDLYFSGSITIGYEF